MRFRKEMRVEVCSNEEGYRGAWFEGVIVGRRICRRSHLFRIRYRDFVTEEGQHLLEDFPAEKIRPIPPQNDALMEDWTVGVAVEARDMDCWWRGIVIKMLSPKFFLVYFPDTLTQELYHISKLRPGYEWISGKWSLPSWERSPDGGEGNSTMVVYGGEAALAPPLQAQPQGQGEQMTQDTGSVPTYALEGATSSEHLRMASNVFDKNRKFRSKKRPLLEDGGFSITLNATPAVEESGRCKILKAGEALQGADSTLWEGNMSEVKRFKFSEQAQALGHIPTRGISKTTDGSEFDRSHAFATKGCTGGAHLSCDQKDNMGVEKEKTEHDTKILKNKILDLARKTTFHELELLAHRFVLRALHARGPLSWKQEVLLTNLRIQLHITPDEYAVDLESLVS